MDDTSGISRRDIEDFRYSCLMSSDRELLDELRRAPVYRKLYPARVPENTPIGGRLRVAGGGGGVKGVKKRGGGGYGGGGSRRKSSHFQYHHEGDHHDDLSDYQCDTYRAGDDSPGYDPTGEEEDDALAGSGSNGRVRFPDIDPAGRRSLRNERGNNKHHVTGIEATTRTRLPDVNGKVDRLVVRQDIDDLTRRDSLDTRITSAKQDYGIDGRYSGGGGNTPPEVFYSAKSKRGATTDDDRKTPGDRVENDIRADARPTSERRGTVRQSSFVEQALSRQHTRDGYYSRQNSRHLDGSSRRALQSDSSRRNIRIAGGERRSSNLTSGKGVTVPTARTTTSDKRKPTVPLCDMTFWQRLELFKKAQRNAYANALGYAQLYRPFPAESWMFGHRIHRAFVFSYFGAPEKVVADPGDGGGGKKKKKKGKKKGKLSEMKSIFGKVLPQDYYPGGKMNVDGCYTADYRQVKV